jgi:CheY-like chemotaxis protein
MRGRIDLRKEPTELATVISQAIETSQPMIDAQGQELTVTTPPEPIRLEADAARLSQVIANLLHNAAKFSNRSGRIWLNVEREGNEVILRIRDEGAGIRAEMLPHVFDLFVQEDRSLERSRGGLGIGLTVVRRLIEMHGGTISARSEGPGKGSEFIVCLPTMDGGSRIADATTNPHPAIRNPQSRRVLVVDDNVDAAESMAMLLRLWGHDVRLAHNGPEALKAASENQPDVMVLDIGLPGMNGYEVAGRLREHPAFQKMLVIAVTGYGQDKDRARSREAGIDHHLTKPVELATLEKLVANAC